MGGYDLLSAQQQTDLQSVALGTAATSSPAQKKLKPSKEVKSSKVAKKKKAPSSRKGTNEGIPPGAFYKAFTETTLDEFSEQELREFLQEKHVFYNGDKAALVLRVSEWCQKNKPLEDAVWYDTFPCTQQYIYRTDLKEKAKTEEAWLKRGPSKREMQAYLRLRGVKFNPNDLKDVIAKLTWTLV